MSKSYHNILSKRLSNQIVAIAYDKFDTITSQVTIRLMQGAALEQGVPTTPHTSVESKDLPVIEVFDSLVAKGGAGSSGFTSYESIAGQLGYLVATGHKDILMYIDSPGGEVAGLFALTSYMSDLRSKGINLIGLTDGLCCSAAYAIGSACSKLVATASSEIGSIGVITALVDVTEADKEDGYKYTILRSKSDKALGNPHEPTTDKIVSKVEAKLAEYDTIFNTEVNKNRPSLSVESIISMKGNTFLGETALSLSLIDAIIPNIQSFIENNSLAQNKSSIQPTTRGLTMTLEEALLAKDSLQAELTNVKATLATATASGKQEEQQRILGILKAATTFSQPIASVEKLVSKGYSADQAVDMFELAAEAKQSAQAVNTANAVDAGAIANALQANNEAKESSWNAKTSALLQPYGVM